MDKRVLLLAATATLSLVEATAAKPPNVIIIFTDDQGYQDLGCYGSPDIKTPNLDDMAAEGLRLTNFYVSAPTSSPSRAALLTGRLNSKNGVPKVLQPDESGLVAEEVTMAEMLKEAGYATACYGKWHLGGKEGQMPMEQGFDDYFGIPYSNNMALAKDQIFAKNCNFREGYTLETAKEMQSRQSSQMLKDIAPLMRGSEIVEFPCDQASTTRRYIDRAINFIDESGTTPFFLYITPAMPHRPYFATEQFLGKSARGIYGDIIEEIDWNVGRLLEHLKSKGLDENTIVIFSSDNGPSIPKKDKPDGGCAKPLRGQKFLVYEGGVRVPFIMKWSGRIPAGVESDAIVASIDLLPSIATFADAKLPDREIDGLDLSLFFTEPTNKANELRDSYLYMTHGRYVGVRVGDWKYLPAGGENYGQNMPSGEAMLFNLAQDPYEQNNLRNEAQAAQIIDRLRAACPELIDEIE